MIDNNLKEEFRERLTEYVEAITEPSKSGLYCCPLCGSGTGQHKTGAFSILNGTFWRCFSCGEKGDIFDLIGKYEGKSTFTEQCEFAQEFFNQDTATTRAPVKKETAPKEYKDFTKVIEALQTPESIAKACEYLEIRGIPADITRSLGYTYNPGEYYYKGGYKREALIIPATRADGGKTYQARFLDIAPDTKAEGKDKTQFVKGGSIGYFNLEAINQDRAPVFICEGAIDATSIITLGGEGIALNGTANAKGLLSVLKKAKCKKYIIATDIDGPGKESANILYEGINAMPGFIAVLIKETIYHDANTWIIKDREGLKKAMQEAIDTVNAIARDKIERYSIKNLIKAFEEYRNAPHPTIKTGFEALDKMIGGGLEPKRLYVIGGAPGTCKSTIALQIADYIASNGQPVLFFSLEMPKEQVMARSISRISYKDIKTTKGLTELEILRNQLNYEQTQLYLQAKKMYEDNEKDTMYIVEERQTAEDITGIIKAFIEEYGKQPVVFIDYLQYIKDSTAQKSETDRGRMIAKVNIITQLKKEVNTPIVVLSALSRGEGNYQNPSMSALKESSSIESDADFVLMLNQDYIMTCEKARASARGKQLKFADKTNNALMYSLIDKMEEYTPINGTNNTTKNRK